jgi:hypothetical protein
MFSYTIDQLRCGSISTGTVLYLNGSRGLVDDMKLAVKGEDNKKYNFLARKTDIKILDICFSLKALW